MHTPIKSLPGRLSLAISMILSLPAYSNAQQVTDENSDMEVITVSAVRSTQPASTIPATMTLISNEQLTEQLAMANGDLSQVLGNILPSFSPSRQKLTNAGETLRGRDPLYMIDGVPQSNPLRDGSRDGLTIDSAMIERVEVIHGASAIQGMGASGGIINIITKSADDIPSQEVSVTMSAPTDGGSDTLSYKTSYLTSASWDKFDLVTGVSWSETGMYKDGHGDLIGVDGAQGDTQDSDSVNVFSKLGYNISAEQRIQLMVNYFNLEGQGNYVSVKGDWDGNVPTGAEEGDFEGDPASNEVTTLTLDYTDENVFNGRLAWQLFYQDFAATYGGGHYSTFQDPNYDDDVFDQSQNNSTKYGSKLTWQLDNVANSQVSIITGLDVLFDETYQELIHTGRNWVPEVNYFNIAPYLQARYEGFENITLSAGVRQEHGELDVDDFTTLEYYGGVDVEGGKPDFDETLLNFGVVYNVIEQVKLYASYSEGFSMPDVGRVLRAIGEENQDVDEFLNLEPIVSDNIEVGVEFNNNDVSAELAFFHSESDLGNRLETNEDGFYDVKREKTEIYGFEANASWYINNDNEVGFSYADTEGKYDSDKDGDVDTRLGGANIPPRRLNLYWQHDWSGAVATRLQVNKFFDRTIDSSEEFGNFNGYETIDLYANFSSRFGDFSVGLENLADEFYYTYYSQTDGKDTRNFTGRGRTVTASWAYQF